MKLSFLIKVVDPTKDRLDLGPESLPKMSPLLHPNALARSETEAPEMVLFLSRR